MRRDAPRKRKKQPQEWTKYRIEVGYKHGVRPGNIVGAITSEAELVGSDIGGIDIQTHFTKVDLPPDLTAAQLESLQHLKVAGQPLKLTKWRESGPGVHGQSKGKKHAGKPKWKSSKTKRKLGKPKAFKKKRSPQPE